MASRLVRAIAALVLTACQNEPVAPGTPPSGLPVTVRALSVEEALAAGPPPYAFARGDSVVALAVINGQCSPVIASAGFEGDELVLTMTQRGQDAPAICIAAAIPTTFRNVIRDVPTRPFYTLVMKQRFEASGQAPQERRIARMTIYR